MHCLPLLGKCVRVLRKSHGSSKTGIKNELLSDIYKEYTNIGHPKELVNRVQSVLFVQWRDNAQDVPRTEGGWRQRLWLELA